MPIDFEDKTDISGLQGGNQPSRAPSLQQINRTQLGAQVPQGDPSNEQGGKASQKHLIGSKDEVAGDQRGAVGPGVQEITGHLMGMQQAPKGNPLTGGDWFTALKDDPEAMYYASMEMVNLIEAAYGVGSPDFSMRNHLSRLGAKAQALKGGGRR